MDRFRATLGQVLRPLVNFGFADRPRVDTAGAVPRRAGGGECRRWSNDRRRALLARATETDTLVTDALSGRSARAVRSAYAEAMAADRLPLPGFQQMYALTDPMLDAGQDDIASFHLYGQAARLNRALPAAELMSCLIEEAQSSFSRLAVR